MPSLACPMKTATCMACQSRAPRYCRRSMRVGYARATDPEICKTPMRRSTLRSPPLTRARSRSPRRRAASISGRSSFECWCSAWRPSSICAFSAASDSCSTRCRVESARSASTARCSDRRLRFAASWRRPARSAAGRSSRARRPARDGRRAAAARSLPRAMAARRA